MPQTCKKSKHFLTETTNTECVVTSIPHHEITFMRPARPARAHIFKNRLQITFDSKTYATRLIVEVYQPLAFHDKASSLPPIRSAYSTCDTQISVPVIRNPFSFLARFPFLSANDLLFMENVSKSCFVCVKWPLWTFSWYVRKVEGIWPWMFCVL